MNIVIASDHAGFRYKETIKDYLTGRGYDVRDLGTHSEEPVDYPDFVRPAAEAVAKGEADRGIVLGGSGNGEAMMANRIKGVRCAICWNRESAALSRRHNDANMLAVGQRMLDIATVFSILDEWLNTPFEGGRHTARIRKLDD